MTFRQAFERTMLEIVRTRDLVAIAVLSVMFYAVYYPAPYEHQTVQALPIAVVDADRSALTRALLRKLAVAHEVTIVAEVRDLGAAKALLRDRRVEGILLLPEGLSRGLAGQRPGTGIALWLDGAYLLRAEGVGLGVAGAITSVAGEQLAGIGRSPVPIAIETHPLFNPTQGYRDYIFPAVANIILQQTLLFATARLCAERRRRGAWQRTPSAFLGTWAACATIGTLAALLYFGAIFWVEDVPHGGNVPALLLVTPLFAATVVAFGLVVGSLVRNGDDALKLLLPTSIPFIFLSGFAWPLSAMPIWVRAFAWMIPVTPATHLFVPLNQMAAALADVRFATGALIGQLIFYGGLAYIRLVRVDPRLSGTAIVAADIPKKNDD